MNIQETSFFDLPAGDENLKGLVFIASPFTHKYREVETMRFELACRAVKEYLMIGVHAISPIVHCYPIAQRHNLPGDYSFWRIYTKTLLKACSAMRVLQLPGWFNSTGISQEVAYANRFKIPMDEIRLHQPVFEAFELAWN